MANRTWVGGASKTAQVDHLTVGGTIEAGDIFKTTLTDESGVAHTVSTTATSTSIETTRDEILADVQASTDSEFLKLTWGESGTTIVTATAKTTGVPFHLTASTTEAGGTAADTQTYARSSNTATSGPNDWAVTANWDEGSVPTTGDDVYISQGSHDILYSLDQSAVSLDSLNIGAGYRGSIGDSANSYYLQIDCDNTGSDKTVTIATSGPAVWWDGTADSVRVLRCMKGAKAVNLAGDINTLRVKTTDVMGQVNCKASMVLDTLYMQDCANAKVVVNTTISSLDAINKHAGELELRSELQAAGTVENKGGTLTITKDVTQTAHSTNVKYTNDNGTTYYNGGGEIDIEVWGGRLTFENNEAPAVTVGSSMVEGGTLVKQGPYDNVTYTTDTQLNGGKSEEGLTR